MESEEMEVLSASDIQFLRNFELFQFIEDFYETEQSNDDGDLQAWGERYWLAWFPQTLKPWLEATIIHDNFYPEAVLETGPGRMVERLRVFEQSFDDFPEERQIEIRLLSSIEKMRFSELMIVTESPLPLHRRFELGSRYYPPDMASYCRSLLDDTGALAVLQLLQDGAGETTNAALFDGFLQMLPETLSPDARQLLAIPIQAYLDKTCDFGLLARDKNVETIAGEQIPVVVPSKFSFLLAAALWISDGGSEYWLARLRVALAYLGFELKQQDAEGDTTGIERREPLREFGKTHHHEISEILKRAVENSIGLSPLQRVKLQFLAHFSLLDLSLASSMPLEVAADAPARTIAILLELGFGLSKVGSEQLTSMLKLLDAKIALPEEFVELIVPSALAWNLGKLDYEYADSKPFLLIASQVTGNSFDDTLFRDAHAQGLKKYEQVRIADGVATLDEGVSTFVKNPSTDQIVLIRSQIEGLHSRLEETGITLADLPEQTRQQFERARVYVSLYEAGIAAPNLVKQVGKLEGDLLGYVQDAGIQAFRMIRATELKLRKKLAELCADGAISKSSVWETAKYEDAAKKKLISEQSPIEDIVRYMTAQKLCQVVHLNRDKFPGPIDAKISFSGLYETFYFRRNSVCHFHGDAQPHLDALEEFSRIVSVLCSGSSDA